MKKIREEESVLDKPENLPVIISIVTHNSQDIFHVLEHLQREIGNDATYQVVIYDNHSDKEYVEQLKKFQPWIQVVCGEENAGFGHGHNRILLQTSAKYGIIFNPDILVTKDTLDRLLQLLQQSNELAAVVPKVLNEDGTTQYLVRHKLTVFDYLLRFIPFSFVKKLFDRRLADYECRFLPDDQTSYITMGSGCFLFIDIDKFKAINGFDEQFFMYFEDNDLCLRWQQKGDKILYTPFETVTHLYGKGAHRSWPLFKVFMKSMKQFFDKWGWKFL